jgi:hypothetical protein
MNDNNCSIHRTYNSVEKEVISMKMKDPWVSVLKKAVEKKKEAKNE